VVGGTEAARMKTSQTAEHFLCGSFVRRKKLKGCAHGLIDFAWCQRNVQIMDLPLALSQVLVLPRFVKGPNLVKAVGHGILL
jgi:hypothetical protein